MSVLKSASELYKQKNGYNNNAKSLPKSFDFNESHGSESGLTIKDFLFKYEKPKLKYLYKVTCEKSKDNLTSSVGCYIKSIDRPKIDIEFVEQVRNNVIRYYPVKYSFPEASMVYYDSGDSMVTDYILNYVGTKIVTIDNQGIGRGKFVGRQNMLNGGSTITVHQIPVHLGNDRASDGFFNETYDVDIPEETIYIYYNVQVTSIDSDQFDTDDDSGYLIYTLTFKYEYFEIKNNPVKRG